MKQKHLIDDVSRVFCPRHGHEVDFERCLNCPGLFEFDVDGKHPFISCDPDLAAGQPRVYTA